MTIRRVRVQLLGAVVSGPAVSTFYFDNATGTTQQAVTAVGTFMNSWQAQVSTALNWASEPEVDFLNESTGQLQSTVTTTPFTGVGTQAGARISSVNQVLLRLFTDTISNGRQVRGRLFIPGFVEATNNVAGEPESASLTPINAAATTLINDPNVNWVLWSRKNGIAPAITLASCWSKYAVLRSRRD